MPQPAAANVLGAYEALRAKLIGKTLSNRMINYRVPIPRSSVGLEITGELSAFVWRSLVIERRKLGFTGPSDPVKGGEDLPLTDSEANHATGDLLLYSPTPKTKRDSRLVATWRGAIEQLEERGVSCLYLALGILEWKEPNENASHRAPLVLVPVALERTAKGDVRLGYEDGEIVTNLSLKSKLGELGLDLPEIPKELDSFDIGTYFSEVGDLCSDQEGFSVRPDDIGLDFFSFEKIALYHDLEIQKWPPEAAPVRDLDVVAILGDGYEGGESPLSDETSIDEIRSAEDSREVFPADSSQLLVILEACRGTSMVVEGPPGTGKSQTIANLIAELTSQGKKVLFVSEKMAALDVVLRRLEEAAIGEAALKMHGQKTSRRVFYDEIKRTWFSRSKLNEASVQLARITEVRNELNEYVRELHEILEPFGVSPRRLITLASSLPDSIDADDDSGYEDVALKDCRWDEMQKLRDRVRIVQEKVRQIGVPSDHPLWGSTLEFFGPEERRQSERALSEAIVQLEKVERRSKDLAEQLGIPNPESLKALSVLHGCVEIAETAPDLGGVRLGAQVWRTEEAPLRIALDCLGRYQNLVQTHRDDLSSNAWEQDWESTRATLAKRAGSLLGRLSADCRQAASRVRAYEKGSRKRSVSELRSLADDLSEGQTLRREISEREVTLSQLYGGQWSGLASNHSKLQELLEWVLSLEAKVARGEVPDSIFKLLSREAPLANLRLESNALAREAEDFRLCADRVLTLLRLPTTRLVGVSLNETRGRLLAWKENLGRVSEMVGWNLLSADTRGSQLETVLNIASRWPLAGERLESLVTRRWVHGALGKAFAERRSLSRFERLKHEQAIEEFRRLDDLILHYNRARVAHAHLAGLPTPGSVGLTAELFRQCELRRGHKSIRWAFERFGSLILQIKPVCMMSPLSVATFLPRLSGLFDVVIFDEASQVKPEDALSAICRANQTVVVGDSKQMPPTSFFDSLVSDDVDEDSEFDAAVGKMESVLALYSAAVQNGYRRRDLRWHYRSLHHALIEPSNRLFYEDRLVVFPSPVYGANAASSDLGLRFRYDPSAVYDRGSSRKVNLQQARQVAETVVQQLRERPQESLMVVAFSKDQQLAIRDAFESLNSPGILTEYEARHPFERFDIKNLETVQGDERDVVFISVAYGRDAKGAVSMNFGPLNKEGGGRRLNVLMSRARRRIEVFSSIRFSDIVADSERETGVTALKVFLEFAETGVLEERAITGFEPDSDFEIQVRDALERHGYTVDCQVGTAGFRIDLAVRHPQKPGLYVLGIECDGATYHSARSARDRDKIRQLVLESRGWQLFRIWSTDWWTDRKNTIKRALAAIEQASEANGDAPVVEQDVSAEELEVWPSEPGLVTPIGAPYLAWNRPLLLQGHELHELPLDVMARCVRMVVEFENPIPEDLLIKRIRESAGKGRAGGRIQDAIREGIKQCVTRSEILRSDAFLYWPRADAVKARSRAGVPATERRLDYIAKEEIDDAIVMTLRSSTGATHGELVEGVKRVLGLGRTLEGMRELVAARVVALGRAKVLTQEGENISLEELQPRR